jgi:hypothetical protein
MMCRRFKRVCSRRPASVGVNESIFRKRPAPDSIQVGSGFPENAII